MIKVAAILKRAIASVGYKKAVAAIVSLIATASVEYKKASASVVSKRAIASIAFGNFYTFLRVYFLDSALLTDEDIIAFGKSLTHQGISQDDLFKSYQKGLLDHSLATDNTRLSHGKIYQDDIAAQDDHSIDIDKSLLDQGESTIAI